MLKHSILLIFILLSSLLYPSTSVYQGILTSHLDQSVNYNNNNSVLIVEERVDDYSLLLLHMKSNSLYQESLGALVGGYWDSNWHFHLGLISGYSDVIFDGRQADGIFIGKLMLLCIVGIDAPITDTISLSVNLFGEGVSVGIKYE